MEGAHVTNTPLVSRVREHGFQKQHMKVTDAALPLLPSILHDHTKQAMQAPIV
jgi:hypothetical protein